LKAAGAEEFIRISSKSAKCPDQPYRILPDMESGTYRLHESIKGIDMWGKKLSLLKNLDEFLIAVLIALVTFILLLQTFCRFLLNSPLIWSEEVARYLFVWATMLGLGYSIRIGIDISMRMFVDLLPRLVQVIIRVAIDLFVIIIYAITIPSAIDYTGKQHYILTAATEVPKSFLTVSVPIGFSLLIIHLAGRIIKTICEYIRGG
jgi:TRAP-type C4-dicarboxylate transport system permease small subunit